MGANKAGGVTPSGKHIPSFVFLLVRVIVIVLFLPRAFDYEHRFAEHAHDEQTNS